MAESTESAIPNKKNSHKHVVIVPIDVHHRHDSQVSQILDPDKASDITKAQQKKLEVVHHQNHGILQADDNLNSLHELVGLPCQDINVISRKTSAERMREYKRRRINVVESELVQEPQHQLPYVEENEDATLSNYSDFYRHRLAHEEFQIKFVDNPFGSFRKDSSGTRIHDSTEVTTVSDSRLCPLGY
ncbi:uncharacterized protein TNCT_213771 [Trichonephila clavata]|uniref:Uncharacterized protein n=1 Tax=Trichonephila clavata TaxID=2740835 RepID=A0A8X6FHT3_TRICU|nr:uncharacterized protein TNCT_213771 [Trichonephila clavata]